MITYVIAGRADDVVTGVDGIATMKPTEVAPPLRMRWGIGRLLLDGC